MKKKIRPSSSMSPGNINMSLNKGKEKFNMTGMNFTINNNITTDFKERSLSKESAKKIIPLKQIKFPQKKTS